MGKPDRKCDGGYKPGCCQGTEDCFAGDGTGRCEALEDTRFASGECPFYKPGYVYEYERVQVKQRLIRLDRADLILKYKVD